MHKRKIATLAVIVALLNLTVLTGCASSSGPIGSAGNNMDNPERQVEVDEQYVQRLRETPPEELTAEEIAYLEMVAQRDQASSLQTISAITVVSAVVTLASAVASIVIASGTGSE